MHHANHYYGHAHILAAYVDMPFPPMILGYLQHGWNNHNGFAVGMNVVGQGPLFVWSDQVVQRGWAMGHRNYHVIGAAWAYLLRLQATRTVAAGPAEDREGTIFYPFHGWEGQEVVGDHQAMLAKLREVEDGPLTVCLYWNEHKNPEIRRVYEEGGCRVITHGTRGFGYRGTDEEFLFKQYSELIAHKRVVSNRLSSAILYGASVGCEVAVYGDPMVLSTEHAVYGGVERHHRMWPELHQEQVPFGLAQEFAHAELGMDFVRDPAEIIDLFRWTRPTWELQ